MKRFSVIEAAQKARVNLVRDQADRLTAHTVCDIEEIYGPWERLWLRDPFATAFTHPAWHRSYLRANAGVAAVIVALRDQAGEVVGVCPLMRRGGTLCFLSTPRPDFMRPTLDPDLDLIAAVDQMLRAARQAAMGATIELSPFHPADPLAAIIAERAGAAAIPVAVYCAGMSLRLTDNVQAGAMRRKFVGSRHVRRHLASIRREGAYRFGRIGSKSEIVDLLPHLFTFQTRRWMGSGNQIFLDEKNQRFYRELVENFPADILHFTRLDLSGRVAALSLDFIVGGVFQHYKSVYDIEQRHARPGLALLCEIGRSAVERGLHTLDFGRGDATYKRRFANHAEERKAVVLYPDRLARAIHGRQQAAKRRLRLGVSATARRLMRHVVKARLDVIQAAVARYGVGGAIAKALARAIQAVRGPRWLLFELAAAGRGVGSRPDDVRFRFGGLADLLDVLELHNRIDRAKHFRRLVGRLEWGEQLFLGHSAGRLVFAGWLAQGDFGGAVSRRQAPAQEGATYLYDCFTAPDHRSSGIFTSALEWALDNRKARGRALVACAAGSRASIRILQRAGFARRAS